MQPLSCLCLETVWYLRYELLVLACALLPQLARPWCQRRFAPASAPPSPLRSRPQKPRQQPPPAPLPGSDPHAEGRAEEKLERKYDSRIQSGGCSPFGSGRPRLRPGPGTGGGAGKPARQAGGSAGGGGAGGEPGFNERVTARQAAKMILAESCRDRGRPLEMHQDALAGGACFEWLPEAEAHRLYLALGLAALRTEGGEPAIALLQDMRRHNVPVPPPLLSLIVKRCAARRLFRRALTAYDVATEGLPGPPPTVDDREFHASLFLAASESVEHARCDTFWASLKAIGTPNAQEYACRIKILAARGDWEEALRAAEAARSEGLALDAAAGGAALQACVQANQHRAGLRVLDLLEEDGRIGKDVAPYHALMKGLALAEDLEEVFRLHRRMQERGIESTQVTYGILLDACVSHSDLESAASVFEEMVTRGCPMNTVLYTTLIKGLAKTGRVDKAMEVYTHMREQSDVKPDIILFSVLIKSNCDAGRMECALQLFQSLVQLGYQPDEIVFNNLLVGCNRNSNLVLGKQLLGEMRRLGVKPSHATASILLKLYAKCHVLDGAQYLLANISEELGVEPEPRLFAQLVQASIRERDGRRAVEVYQMMVRDAPPDASTTGSILSTCLQCGMLDTAVELHNTAVQAGCEVPSKDTAAVQKALELGTRPAPQGLGEGLLGKRRCYCGP